MFINLTRNMGILKHSSDELNDSKTKCLNNDFEVYMGRGGIYFFNSYIYLLGLAQGMGEPGGLLSMGSHRVGHN